MKILGRLVADRMSDRQKPTTKRRGQMIISRCSRQKLVFKVVELDGTDTFSDERHIQRILLEEPSHIMLWDTIENDTIDGIELDYHTISSISQVEAGKRERSHYYIFCGTCHLKRI